HTTTRPPPTHPLFPYTTLFRSPHHRQHPEAHQAVEALHVLVRDFPHDQPDHDGDGRDPEQVVQPGHQLDDQGHPTDLGDQGEHRDRKSTRLNSSHDQISYAVFC